MVETEKWMQRNVSAGATTPTDGIAGWATTITETLGGPGAALAIALENLFPPIPSEVILPLAGFTASRGDMTLLGAIVWTTLGSLVGAAVLYAGGALLGRHRMRVVRRLPYRPRPAGAAHQRALTHIRVPALWAGPGCGP